MVEAMTSTLVDEGERVIALVKEILRQIPSGGRSALTEEDWFEIWRVARYIEDRRRELSEASS